MPKAKFSLADLSDDDKRQLLSRALAAATGADADCYVRDVYADAFVYMDYDAQALYRRSYKIADDLVVTLGPGEAVTERTVYEPVATFTLAGSKRVEGDTVIYPNSFIFEAGSYPDKKFAITPEEIAQKVSAYAGGAQVNLEHSGTPFLNGKLGEVRSLFVDVDNPAIMRGEVAIPSWLDAAAPEGGFKCSAEWNTASKDFLGLALTETPRVTGAALMSAYTAFSQKAELTPDKPANAKEKRPMEFPKTLKEFVALFTGETPTVDPANPAAVIVPAKPDADPQVAKLEAQIAQMSTQMIDTEAKAFADGIIADKRALPVEHGAIVAQFATARKDDIANPTVVKFSVADKQIEGSRVDLLTAQYAARPQHVLTDEVVGSSRVLFNKPAEAADLEAVEASAKAYAAKVNPKGASK